ncbi:MAG: hypothetical protein G8345_21680, partial [Magnetococcales bacterium]|nr:hypothetical protein [Magnetococcales bacterium]
KEIIRGLAAGADNYLTKPYDEHDLLERISQLLALPHQTGEMESGLAVSFAGEQHVVTSNRHQILNLLLSTYENAVRRNKELIKAQMELRVLNERLEEKVLERTRQLEEANQAKSVFISNMSHELRTPMNAIIGMTELCLAAEMPDSQRNLLEIVRSSADSLLYLLNSLLDFSRLESGSLTPQPVKFYLRAQLKEWLQHPLQKAKEKNLSFFCQVDSNVSDHFLGDMQRLREILNQLVNNALKFTHHGEVVIHVRCLEPTMVEETPAMKLSFAVRDTGIGIPCAQQENIFESFAQGDGSATRRYGGTGIGLTLARQLTQLIGGHLVMESRHAEDGFPIMECGSSFSIEVTFKVLPGKADFSQQDELILAYRALVGDNKAEGVVPPRLEPSVMQRQDILKNSLMLLAAMEQEIDQKEGTRLDLPAQWLKKAMDFLEIEGGREGVLRILMSARKGNWQEAGSNLTSLYNMLKNL